MTTTAEAAELDDAARRGNDASPIALPLDSFERVREMDEDICWMDPAKHLTLQAEPSCRSSGAGVVLHLRQMIAHVLEC